MKKQRTFTASFKAKVAMEAIKGVKTLEKISNEYEVHQTQINKWKSIGLKMFPMVFEKNDADQIERLKDEHEKETKKLYEEIGRLKVENDFLKKISER